MTPLQKLIEVRPEPATTDLPGAFDRPHNVNLPGRACRIVRIITRLNVGGPAKHVSWLTAGLQDQDYESTLITGSVPPGEADMGYFASSLGVRPLLIPQMSRELSLGDALVVWKVYRALCQLKPQIIHTHTAKAGTIGRAAGFLYRWGTLGTLVGRPRFCRVVHTYHGHIFHSYYSRLKTRLFLLIEQVLARLATHRIVTISPEQLREIHHKFGVGRASQFRVIPLGLDLSPFQDWESRRHALREEIWAKPEELLVGIVGRLTEIKNHKLFIQSAALTKALWQKQGSGRVRFLVIGDGNLRSELETLARQLGLEDDMIFLGTRSDPETFYPALDVLALTSLNEGTPLTLIEGMANGRPIVASAVGGVVDLVGPPRENCQDRGSQYTICQHGILVPSEDAAGFAAALVRLLQDQGLRQDMSRLGLQFVHREYSRDRLISDIRSLYSELLPR